MLSRKSEEGSGGANLRRLEDLVHALGSKSTFHQIAYGNGANKRRQTRILALLLGRAFVKNLRRLERLQS